MRSGSSAAGWTSELSSGLQKAPEPFTYLLMGENFSAFQSCFAPLHRFDETILFLEITGDNILHNFVCLLGGPRGRLAARSGPAGRGRNELPWPHHTAKRLPVQLHFVLVLFRSRSLAPVLSGLPYRSWNVCHDSPGPVDAAAVPAAKASALQLRNGHAPATPSRRSACVAAFRRPIAAATTNMLVTSTTVKAIAGKETKSAPRAFTICNARTAVIRPRGSMRNNNSLSAGPEPRMLHRVPQIAAIRAINRATRIATIGKI